MGSTLPAVAWPRLPCDTSLLAYTLPHMYGSRAEGKAAGRLSLSACKPSLTSSVKKPSISSASE